jgi:hypothetical protein
VTVHCLAERAGERMLVERGPAFLLERVHHSECAFELTLPQRLWLEASVYFFQPDQL